MVTVQQYRQQKKDFRRVFGMYAVRVGSKFAYTGLKYKVDAELLAKELRRRGHKRVSVKKL